MAAYGLRWEGGRGLVLGSWGQSSVSFPAPALWAFLYFDIKGRPGRNLSNIMAGNWLSLLLSHPVRGLGLLMG